MANKFTQSVMQRLEQEAAKGKPDPAPTVPPAAPPTETVNPPKKSAGQGRGDRSVDKEKSITAAKKEERANIDPPETIVPDLPRSQPANEEPLPPAPAPDTPDLSAYLDLRPARQAKNKTFYLDLKVIDAITHAARAQGIADSKLVNGILKSVLGVE